MKKLLIVLFLALLIANICNCGGGGGSSTSTSGKTIVTINLGETRTASYSDGKLLSESSTTIPSNIVNIRFTISAPDMATIERIISVVGKTTISESFEVPNGANRHFLVEAMDASGNRLYWGDTYKDLVGTPLSFEIIMAKDDIPPTFSGISSIDSITSTSMRLSWSPATDNLTPQDKIQYLIYKSTTSSGQDFNQTPSFTTPQGANSYVATGLTPSTTYYFVVRAKDEAGNSDTNITEMSGTTPQPSPTCDADDLSKAKSLVTDIRNTVLSIYNYQGSGVPSIFDTPFKNLSEELTTKIEPELTDTVDRIAWIIESAGNVEPGTTGTFTEPPYILTMTTLTLSGDEKTATFTVKEDGTTIDSGTIEIDKALKDLPTTGTFIATMKTVSGNLTADLSYSGTVDSNGLYTSMTFTGSMTAPGLSVDFSQSGRKLSVTLAPIPGKTIVGIEDVEEMYPTSIYLSGRITTGTAQMDGALDISSIVWNLISDLPLPESATFDGSFEELKDGSTTGVKFIGKITGSWDNADTYNTNIDETLSNFPMWNASFEGKIEAPSRPAITALLKVAQIAHNKLSLEVDFQRTNTDGTVVSLSGTGEFNGEYDSNGDGVDDGEILTATLSNQCSMKIYITFIPQNPKDNQFTGTITNSGGEKMADLYTLNGVPMVKYIDNYIESIF